MHFIFILDGLCIRLHSVDTTCNMCLDFISLIGLVWCSELRSIHFYNNVTLYFNKLHKNLDASACSSNQSASNSNSIVPLHYYTLVDFNQSTSIVSVTCLIYGLNSEKLTQKVY